MLLRVRCFAMVVLSCVVVSLAHAQETADTAERNSGPRNLAITYRSTPTKRPSLRTYMLKQGVQRSAKWIQDGVLADYRILFNRYNDAETYDIMSVLNF